MALPGALRDLTLALGAAVAAVGSLLFIAWKVYFRGTGTGTDWDGWWEQELRELRDRAPPGDTVRGGWGWTLARTPGPSQGRKGIGSGSPRDPLYREPLSGIPPIPTGQGVGIPPASSHARDRQAGEGAGGRDRPCDHQAGEGSGWPAGIPLSTRGWGRGCGVRIPLGSRTRIPQSGSDRIPRDIPQDIPLGDPAAAHPAGVGVPGLNHHWSPPGWRQRGTGAGGGGGVRTPGSGLIPQPAAQARGCGSWDQPPPTPCPPCAPTAGLAAGAGAGAGRGREEQRPALHL